MSARDITDEGEKVWWHGSASGDLRGGASGLHLGTREAATVALEARIGIPADGNGWSGDRTYGETLLAGAKSIRSGRFGKFRETGFNCGGARAPFPEDDFYPADYFKDHPDAWPKYPGGLKMPLSVRPSVDPYAIRCRMTNSVHAPHQDFKANGYMKAALSRGRAVNGYYYRNDAEDAGSISAVVPNGSHLLPLKRLPEAEVPSEEVEAPASGYGR